MSEPRLRHWFGQTRDEQGMYQPMPWVREAWDEARRGGWAKVFELLRANNHSSSPLLHAINSFCPWHEAQHSFLHLAAEQGAKAEVIERMIEAGAWRSLQNGKGNRPIDLARKAGHDHLLEILKPRFTREVPFAEVLEIQQRLHSVMRRWDNLGGRLAEHRFAMPQLQPMLEGEAMPCRCGVFFWHGAFIYELSTTGRGPTLDVRGGSRVSGGTACHFQITIDSTVQVPLAGT